MTDLIDRIRAYVAAIPTHNCGECGTGFTPKEDDADEECTQCGYIGYGTSEFGDSDADALLREVAALVPVAYVNTCFLFDSEMYRDETHSTAILWRLPQGDESDLALYTLTGATHGK